MAEEKEDPGFKVVDRRSGAGIAGGDPAEAAHAHAAPEARHEGSPGFADLVHSLQFGAMLHLGMVQDHEGKRSPVDLVAARDAIDMMGVLKEKTKGNLTAEEDGMLSEGLYVLRMAYLAAAGGEKPQGGGSPR